MATATQDRMVVEGAERVSDSVDVICPAQVSMALARAAVQVRVNVPALASPATELKPFRDSRKWQHESPRGGTR